MKSPELVAELGSVSRAGAGRLDAEDEQRDRDREDAVAERARPGRRRAGPARASSAMRVRRSRRDEAEAADLVALGDELLGRDPDASPARSRRARCPRRPSSVVAVAAHREAELQALGRAVLAAARDRERVPVAAAGRSARRCSPSRSPRARPTRPTTSPAPR